MNDPSGQCVHEMHPVKSGAGESGLHGQSKWTCRELSVHRDGLERERQRTYVICNLHMNLTSEKIMSQNYRAK